MGDWKDKYIPKTGKADIATQEPLEQEPVKEETSWMDKYHGKSLKKKVSSTSTSSASTSVSGESEKAAPLAGEVKEPTPGISALAPTEPIKVAGDPLQYLQRDRSTPTAPTPEELRRQEQKIAGAAMITQNKGQLHQQAYTYAKDQQHYASNAIADIIEQKFPEDYYPNQLKANNYLNTDQPDLAVKELDVAIAKSSDNPNLYAQRAVAKQRAGVDATMDAKAYIQSVGGMAHGNKDVANELSNMYAVSGDEEKAKYWRSNYNELVKEEGRQAEAKTLQGFPDWFYSVSPITSPMVSLGAGIETMKEAKTVPQFLSGAMETTMGAMGYVVPSMAQFNMVAGATGEVLPEQVNQMIFAPVSTLFSDAQSSEWAKLGYQIGDLVTLGLFMKGKDVLAKKMLNKEPLKPEEAYSVAEEVGNMKSADIDNTIKQAETFSNKQEAARQVSEGMKAVPDVPAYRIGDKLYTGENAKTAFLGDLTKAREKGASKVDWEVSVDEATANEAREMFRQKVTPEVKVAEEIKAEPLKTGEEIKAETLKPEEITPEVAEKPVAEIPPKENVSIMTEGDHEKIKNTGNDAQYNLQKYVNKIQVGTTGKYQRNVFKYEATNPFTGEKIIFDREYKAADYVINEATRATTRRGREEIFNEISDKYDEQIKSVVEKPITELPKEKIVEPTEAKPVRPSIVSEIEKVKSKKEGETYAIKGGEIKEGGVPEYKGVPQGENIPKDKTQVREVEGEQAGGGGGYEKGREVTPEIRQRFKNTADKIRSFKIQEGLEGAKTAGISDTKLWNDALDTAANIVETTGDVSQAITDGLSKLQSKEDKTEFERMMRENFEPKEQKVFGETRDKKVLNRILTSEKLDQEIRNNISKEGLSYVPKSQKEAKDVARSVIENGIDDAVDMAEAGKFHGDVNSLIFSESLNKLVELEDAAKIPQEAMQYANKFAEVSLRFDEAARGQGRFISAIQEFYKKSPLGMAVKENMARAKTFEEWFKNKEQSFKELFDEIVSTPGGKEELKTRFEDFRREERRQDRQQRREKIISVFDNAKLSKEVTYATIIPPDVINGGIELIKQAVLAGESIANAIDSGIRHISDKLGKEWDTEKFRLEWEDRLKAIDKGGRKPTGKEKTLLDKIESVEKSIASYEQKIAELKRTGDPKLKAAKIEEELKPFLKQRDEIRKEYQDLRSETADWKKRKSEQYLERFKTKLKGLSEDKKELVIRRAMKQLLDSGALEYSDFRKIIADVVGLGELKPEQVTKIKELNKIINATEDARLKALKDETPESLKAYETAARESEIAARELASMMFTKADPTTTLWNIMRLNTLGVTTLLMNPMYNVTWRPVELIKSGLLTAVDYSLYGVSGVLNKISPKIPLYKPTRNVILAQREYFKQMGYGTEKAAHQFKTGTRSIDYFADTKSSSSIRPWRSMKDLYSWGKGELFLTKGQVIDKFLQSTVGLNAEFIARSLNLGDMPFRFAAEGGEAAQLAKLEFGLKNKQDIALFLKFPKEQAYKWYKEKGLSDDVAAEKADYIVKRIVEKGEKTVMQNDNYINDIVKLIDRGLIPMRNDMSASAQAFRNIGNNVVRALKTLNMPYAKIPLNVAWNLYNLTNPALAGAQSLFFGGLSAFHKAKGNHILARKYADLSADWFAHGVAGMALTQVASSLLSNGLITTSDREDKRAAQGEALYGKSRSINMTGVGRMMRGDSTEMKDGDLLVDLQWSGILGNIINTKAGIMDASKKASEKEEEFNFVDYMMESMKQATVEVALNGVFSGTAGMMKAINDGGGYADAWAINMLNLGINIVEPATYAQLSRASLDYKASWRADSFIKEIGENQKQRDILFRLAAGKPQPAITIWGDTAMRQPGAKAVMFNMLRVQEYDNTQFGVVLYQDYLKSKNSKLFPPAVPKTINIDGKDVKLTQDEYRDYCILVGQARKNLVEPFISGIAYAYTEDGEKYYEELTDEEKVKVLGNIYSEGRKNALWEMVEKHPRLVGGESITP